ncbi:MAG TPA: hypothetical protein PKE69_07145 [Pyrinomonadaceae bacterium]|nr:hypothetical protein [Pyrinomonadaceae bacterium]
MEKDAAYTKIFARLEKEKSVDEFFTGNIESLLDAAGEVERNEVREKYSQNILDVELKVIKK